MATIFTKIIEGEIPCYKVAEDERHIAFLDINPVAPGHTLVVPKHEVSYLFDLDDEEYVALELFAKKVAKGLRKAMPCKRIGETVIGLEVPHAHIHLIPLCPYQGSDRGGVIPAPLSLRFLPYLLPNQTT